MLKRALVFAGTAGAGVVLFAGSAFAQSGPEHFHIISTGPRSAVNATGPVHGSGRDVTVNNNVDRFTFPGQGSVNVAHQQASSHESFNPVACVGTFRERGTWAFTGGTGQYQGTTGSGTYSASGVFIAKHTSNGCSQSGGTSIFVVNGSGHATVPQ